MSLERAPSSTTVRAFAATAGNRNNAVGNDTKAAR